MHAGKFLLKKLLYMFLALSILILFSQEQLIYNCQPPEMEISFPVR